MTSRLAGAVLAAGAGRRFGGVKALAEIDGEPLVRRACRAALEAALRPVFVVLGAHAGEVDRALVDLAVRRIVHPLWAEGIGSSIACAVRAAADDDATEGLLLMLSDQPLVTSAHLGALSARWRESPASIVASRYRGVVGVPAAFGRAHFAALGGLSGDRGARSVVASCGDLAVIDFDDAAVDVDTPADLEALRRGAPLPGDQRASALRAWRTRGDADAPFSPGTSRISTRPAVTPRR